MEVDNNQIQDVIKPQADTHVTPQLPAHVGNRPKMPNVNPKWVVGGLVLVALVALAMGWSWMLFGHRQKAPYDENLAIRQNEFQAVFLTNGQVYFGKLADLNHQYVTITDIYYLQVQQANGSLQNASSSATTNSQVSLAKLGSELHGPEDKMSVSRDQVLFWENLKSDSKVVEAIQKYQNK